MTDPTDAETEDAASRERGDPLHRRQTPGAFLGMGVALGIAVGAAVGIALDNLAVGVGIGIAIGAGTGAAFGSRRESEGSDGDQG